MTTLFNYDPYYDDFDEDKNFLRVLFRPGYSVQARELTQLQTILANQIEKFGNHIFKSGSPIIGGKISLDRKANYIVLQTQYANADIDPSQFEGKTIVSYNSSKLVRAKVLAVDTTSANPILVVKYLSGDKFAANEEIRVYGQNIFAKLRNTAATGGSFVASIQEGVYYFKGQFIKVVPQFLIVELFYRIGDSATVNIKPSYKIGLQFDENIIDEIDDTSLLDPAQGAFNYQAPGAHRFQIGATLSKRTLDSADTSTFFEIVRLVNDVKTKEIDYAVYSELEKTMARRTYDESGNYTVDPFVISLEEGAGSASGKFNVVLDPGKAYVGGFEFETIAPTTISVNRARTTANVSDYDIATNYESTVVLANVRNTLDITAYPVLDVHSVTHDKVNTSTAIAYNSTKIGTVRASMIRFNDAFDRANGRTHTFYTHIFGANSVPVTGTVATGSTNTVIKLPSTFSSSAGANAYANMYFRITNGALSQLSPVLINSSDSVNSTITLSTALSYAPTTANTFSIESDFRNAESLVANGGLYIAFAGNIDADSKQTSTGWAYINEPSSTSLIFDTPFEAIKQETISNMDFYARKKYSLTSAADGKITVTADTSKGDTFGWFSSVPGTTISDSLIEENIICFVRSDSATNVASGIIANTVLSLGFSGFNVVSAGPSEFTANVKLAGVKVDMLVKTKLNNAENPTTGYIRNKTFVPSTAGVNLHAKVPFGMAAGDTLAAANTGVVTVVSGVGYVYEDIGATNFTDTNTLRDLRTPGKAVSLQVPDVYEIVKIVDSGSLSANVTTAMLASASNDVTNRYDFDNGQRKTHYDHATIKLKRGVSSPRGRIYVQYKYFKHATTTGLFTVDSYTRASSNVGYSGISVFNNAEDRKLTSLRSSFDFRPSRLIGSTTITNGLNVEPLEAIETSFDYYLGRIDRVVVKPSKEFSVISGASAVEPIAPPVDTKDMLIYTLYIPPYTEDVKDIRVEFKNNRRYTMENISDFEDRIRGLEYYVALNSLEKDAASTKVLDSNGLERSKYGIVVDNFTTKDLQATRSDVGYDNRNLVENRLLKPASLMRTVKLSANSALFSGATRVVGTGTKKALMLNYTTAEFAKQPYATKSLPIANALFAGFKGVTRLYPEFTGDVDTGVTAKVTLNSTQSIAQAFNFINDAFKYISNNNPQWRQDADSPFAQTATDSWYAGTRITKSEGAIQTTNLGGRTWGNVVPVYENKFVSTTTQFSQQQISTSTSQVDVGTFVTDLAIQPFMKPKKIIFSSVGLRPSTVFYAFFDDVDVNKYIVVPNRVTLNASTQLSDGETALIANTISDLAANLRSLLSGGTSYDDVYVVCSEEGSANVSIVNETGKSLSGKFIYGIDSGRYYTISTVQDHRSGTGTASGSTIVLQSDASATNDFYNGNTITIVRATSSEVGIGQQYTITDYVGSTRTATLSSTVETTGSVVYSIGSNRSDKLGQVGGAFYMPSATFRSGQRTFRVTESFNNTYDADAISFADKVYTSSGLTVNKTTVVDTVLNVDVDSKIVGTRTSEALVSTRQVDTRILETWTVDPLAQTFFVDPQVYPYGVYMSSVDLYFRAKDDENLPVYVQIRPTVNGTPSSDYWYPESVVVKYPSQIAVSETPSVTNSATATNFAFSFPVYLKPGLYALVVLTDSPDYILWEAEKGATTRNNEFVDKQPYMGTLYKSQNTMEYVPFLNEDLMFKLNRCVFNTSSAANFVLESDTQPSTINVDRVRLLEKAINPSDKVTTITHTLRANTILGVKEVSGREISPDIIYDYSTDTLYPIGNRRKKLGLKNDFTVGISMSTSSDAVTPIISTESLFLNVWENFVDNGSITSDDFTIIDSGSGYSNSNTVIITSSTGVGATANLNVDANGSVMSVFVSNPGYGYLDDYTISYYQHPTDPAVIQLNSEFDSSGGPCLARYITKAITLADGYDAGDLRVFLAANKPGESEVHVFYKILNADDATDFKDRPYQKMVCINPNIAPDLNQENYREYEFRPSAVLNQISYTSASGVTYDTFKTFSIKIVLTSSDPAIVPTVKDLRIIASPGE